MFRQCFEMNADCKNPQTMFSRFAKKYPDAWDVWGETFEYMLENGLESQGEDGWHLWLYIDEQFNAHYMAIVLTDPGQKI